MRQPATIRQLLLASITISLCTAIGGLFFSFIGAGYGMLVGIPLALLAIFMTTTPAQYKPGNPYLQRRAEHIRKNAMANRNMLAILLLATFTLAACGQEDLRQVQIADAIARGEQARADGQVQQAQIALEAQKANEAAILEQQRIAAASAKAAADAKTEQDRLNALANQAAANVAIANASVGIAQAETDWKIVESQEVTERQSDENKYKPWIVALVGLLVIAGVWLYLDWKRKMRIIDMEETYLLNPPRDNPPRAQLIPVPALPEIPEHVRLVAIENAGQAFQSATIPGMWIIICPSGKTISMRANPQQRQIEQHPQRMITRQDGYTNR